MYKKFMLIAQLPMLDVTEKVHVNYHGLSSTDGNSQPALSRSLSYDLPLLDYRVVKASLVCYILART